MDTKVGAIIIAGGKSSRMGSDKGLMLLNGKPLIGYIISALIPISSEILISTNNPAYEQFGFPLIPDEHSSIGPIGGLQAAIKHSTSNQNLVVSCDTPFIASEILNKIATAGFDNCAFLDSEKQIHPLIGLYSKEIEKAIEFQISKENYKMMDLLELINCQLYTPSNQLLAKYPNLTFNVNTPESFVEAEKIIAQQMH